MYSISPGILFLNNCFEKYKSNKTQKSYPIIPD